MPGGEVQAAVVGIGTTDYGKLPEHDATTLGVWAFREALADCGLKASEIDGLILHRIPDYQKFVRLTGLVPRFLNVVPPQGRMSGVTIQLASSVIRAGGAKTIAVVYGNGGKSAGATYGGAGDRYGTGAEQLWFPYGMTSPGAVHALMFQRHRHLYNTTTEQLGAISVAFRHHASLNPAAVMKKPITIDDHENARFICDPLRLLDYCLINDGGVAMILTDGARAKDFPHKPAYLRGYAMESRLAAGEFSEDFGRECMGSVASRTYGMAGVERSDIDALMIYDNFTPSVLFNLEGFGFCKPGESGPWVAEGNLRLGSKLPANTSGGHLSESYMQGWNLNVEAVRQIRGTAGDRQVRDARLVQYISGGPISTSMIYGADER